MIIYALGIHTGGGKVLLDHILTSDMLGPISILICDSRYIIPVNFKPKIKIIFIKPTLYNRWFAELILKKESKAHPDNPILCFSSMPPAFRLSGKTILFFQNALLLPKVKFNFSSIKTRLRITYEKIWIHLFIDHVNEIWIQSNWMRKFFFKTQATIITKPFLPIFPTASKEIAKKYRYICVTGNADHKMLLELINSWADIKDPEMSILIVTETPNFKIQQIINELDNKNIHFHFNATRTEIFNFYQQSEALIVTSQIESFCLPIYEAHHFNLKIIALKTLFTKEISIVNYFINDVSKDEFIKADQFIKNCI